MRNQLAQQSIEQAEQGDYSEAKMFLKLLENPFCDELIENILFEFYEEHKSGRIIFLNYLIKLKNFNPVFF